MRFPHSPFPDSQISKSTLTLDRGCPNVPLRMSVGVKDIRHLYPRISENHLRYLEKWGLIRPASVRGASGEFTFSDVATIKQLSTELERDVPLKVALRSLMADHQGQLEQKRRGLRWGGDALPGSSGAHSPHAF